ncbi:MAG TPA: molybdopterin synthase sulfur carrier subunit [Candidatus Acetothermia bacterium]|nr:molybdopterin synthase sulfur carrier subunit [Candidatus Acetothermia bacterium]
MKVTVEVSFSFKSELDDNPVTIDLAEGADVMTALRALARLQPQVSSRIFGPSDEVMPYINVLKNGGNVRFQRGFATQLQDGDCLTLIPPVGGG